MCEKISYVWKFVDQRGMECIVLLIILGVNWLVDRRIVLGVDGSGDLWPVVNRPWSFIFRLKVSLSRVIDRGEIVELRSLHVGRDRGDDGLKVHAALGLLLLLRPVEREIPGGRGATDVVIKSTRWLILLVCSLGLVVLDWWLPGELESCEGQKTVRNRAVPVREAVDGAERRGRVIILLIGRIIQIGRGSVSKAGWRSVVDYWLVVGYTLLWLMILYARVHDLLMSKFIFLFKTI